MKCPAFPEPERAIEPLRFLIVRTDRQHNLLDCHVSCVSNAITQQSCSYPPTAHCRYHRQRVNIILSCPRLIIHSIKRRSDNISDYIKCLLAHLPVMCTFISNQQSDRRTVTQTSHERMCPTIQHIITFYQIHEDGMLDRVRNFHLQCGRHSPHDERSIVSRGLPDYNIILHTSLCAWARLFPLSFGK